MGDSGAPPRPASTSLLLQLVAGAGSGAFSKTLTAPLERIKIVFQVQGMKPADLLAPKYTGILQALRVVVAEEGFAALWKGNGANVLRVIPVDGAWTGRRARRVGVCAAPHSLFQDHPSSRCKVRV